MTLISIARDRGLRGVTRIEQERVNTQMGLRRKDGFGLEDEARIRMRPSSYWRRRSEEICVWVFSLGVCGLWGWVGASDGCCWCSVAVYGFHGFAGWGREDGAALACRCAGGFGG